MYELDRFAEYFTPVNKRLITTGELSPVENTPMDSRAPTVTGSRIEEPHEQLLLEKGYDHNWVLTDWAGKAQKAAELCEPKSGHFLTVSTEQAGLQFYSRNFFNGTASRRNGVKYQRRTALCLEAQRFPDSPSKQHCASAVLRPDEVYRQATIYHFSTKAYAERHTRAQQPFP